MLETGFLLTILSVSILFGTEILQQYISNHDDEEKQFDPIESLLFIFSFQVPILLIIVLIFLPEQLNIFSKFGIEIFKYFIFVAMLNLIADVYYFKSLEVKNLSLRNIVLSTSFIFATFGGWLFMSEKIYLEKILGSILILLAVVLVFGKSIHFEKKHLLAFIAAFFYGAVVTLDSFILTKFSIHPLIYMFGAYFLILIFGLLLYYKTFWNKIKKTKIKNFQNIFISSVGYLILNILIFFAYKHGGEAGRIDAINNFEIFLIILFEYFFLKQKQDLWLKITSFVLSLIGVILLGMF